MSAPSQEGRTRLKAFRLSDIPTVVRMDAYDRCLKGVDVMRPNGLFEVAQLGAAAAEPSERVYFVSVEAWERASSKRIWKAARR